LLRVQLHKDNSTVEHVHLENAGFSAPQAASAVQPLCLRTGHFNHSLGFRYLDFAKVFLSASKCFFWISYHRTFSKNSINFPSNYQKTMRLFH